MGQAPSTKPNFIERKRENHAIFGEITLVESLETHLLFTRKSLDMPRMAKLAPYMQVLTRQRQQPFLQIRSLIQDQPCLSLSSCAVDSQSLILLDCVEIDVETLQQSKPFSFCELINMMLCVVQAIIDLSHHKIGVLPISNKTILLFNGRDEFKGEDLSTAIFKIIPSPYAILLENSSFYQNAQTKRKHPQSQNQFCNRVYQLGVLVKDLLASNQQSFSQHGIYEMQKWRTQDNNMSNLLHRMTEIDIKQRISIYEVREEIKRIKFSNDSRSEITKLHWNHNNTNKIINKQIDCSQPSTARFTKGENCEMLSQINPAHYCFKSPVNKNQYLAHSASFTENYFTLESVEASGFSLVKNNKKSCQQGPLRILFQNGAIYEGGVDDDQHFNGFGTLYYSANQICYTGFWKNNAFHGFGYLYNNNKRLFIESSDETDLKCRQWRHYEGQFENDLKQGYGRLYFQDGTMFEGEFENDKPKIGSRAIKKYNKYGNSEASKDVFTSLTDNRSKSVVNFY